MMVLAIGIMALALAITLAIMATTVAMAPTGRITPIPMVVLMVVLDIMEGQEFSPKFVANQVIQLRPAGILAKLRTMVHLPL